MTILLIDVDFFPHLHLGILPKSVTHNPIAHLKSSQDLVILHFSLCNSAAMASMAKTLCAIVCSSSSFGHHYECHFEVCLSPLFPRGFSYLRYGSNFALLWVWSSPSVGFKSSRSQASNPAFLVSLALRYLSPPISGSSTFCRESPVSVLGN